MTITFFINYLNHHQVAVADELYKIIGDDFHYVATYPYNNNELKGGLDYSNRPYCLLAANDTNDRDRALKLNLSSDVCVYGAGNLDWEKKRAVTDKLSFEISERWFKRGLVNTFSPRLIKWWWLYQTKIRHKPFYKLCASAFTAKDCRKLLAFNNKCYKWGYFTKINKDYVIEDNEFSNIEFRIMWCSRYISWKHPEIPLLMAERLKIKGYKFILDMYGSGDLEPFCRELTNKLNITDVVIFHGGISNEELMSEMKKHHIFIFTSDRNEGWGAVANESMGNGCALIASSEIGAIPYLVEDGVNGCIFQTPSPNSNYLSPDFNALNSLCEKIEFLLNNRKKLLSIRMAAVHTMQNIWSPEQAALNFLQLISDLQEGKETSIKEGPCSKA